VNGVVTVYVGEHYEVQGGTIRKYYYAGTQRVAMRESGTLYWLLTDHLGSTAITANGASGAKVAEVRYKAWGEDRYTSGTTPTTYRYTGQRWEAGLGLYFYRARWYDPALGRFAQPDTLVPNPADPQSLNRYAYVRNNPLRYMDSSGHYEEEGTGMEDYELIPLAELLRMDREVALRYLLNYLRAQFGIVPAAGVVVRYMGENTENPGILAENVDYGDDDAYINIYEGAFAEARGTSDVLGFLVHEITHSYQEQAIEAKYGPDVWVKPSGDECKPPGVERPFESKGDQYAAIREIKASEAALDLAPQMNYSGRFLSIMTRYRDDWNEILNAPSDKFCHRGFWRRTIP
jgi:RHS repeat-associated protein